jgi:folate-binding protein YgfZ
MDTDTIPLEAGIEARAISFTKGCYVGQEVIVRVVHRGGGRVARRLVGLQLDGDAPPAPNAGLRHDGRDVGRVTSAAWSPRAGAAVALGYVRREFVEPGTRLAVDCSGIWTPATVHTLPMR